MPKTLFVDPKESLKKRKIHAQTIDICSYEKNIKDELKVFSAKQLLGIYEDMILIREFETMLTECKIKKECYGRKFAYLGGAHISIGEEAAAVGQAFLLSKDDFIFGNHRSHHEILAKAFSAIRSMSDDELIVIMNQCNQGVNKEIVLGQYPTHTVQEQATSFFIFSFMCELFSKKCGFTHGLGGSMHTVFTPFGIYPNNGIVGAGAPLASGAALYKKVMKKKGIVIANLGDASSGRGSVYEAMNLSGMAQFDSLWEKGYQGGLPVIFNFSNNAYGMGDQPKGETMAFDQLSALGMISKNGMNAETVNGLDPLAVIDATRRKIRLIKENKGPVLLELITYRFSGHSSGDVNAYRSQDEIETWRNLDPLSVYPQRLIGAEIASQSEIEAIRDKARSRIKDLFFLAIDEKVAPLIDPNEDSDFVSRYLYSNRHIPFSFDPELTPLFEANSRIKSLRQQGRKNITLSMREVIYQILLKRLLQDPELILYGEDVRDWGGCFDVTRGLAESLPYHKVFNAPISESAIVGSAVGYAMAGGKAIVEIMYQDFMACSGDEILNQLAKWQAMSAGAIQLPIVLRTVVGSKHGAQHTQDLSAFWAHIPGLKVVYPVTPRDAAGLLNRCLNGSDPVIFIESQLAYDQTETFDDLESIDQIEIELGQPVIRRSGKDLTILTLGPILFRAMKAAEILSKEYGIEAEVIDMRGLVPFDYTMVKASVEKTKRILLASDEVTRGSSLNDVAQKITQLCFNHLDVAPVVIGSKNWIAPADEYDKYFFPQVTTFLDVIHRQLIHLKGYTVSDSDPLTDLISGSRKGY